MRLSVGDLELYLSSMSQVFFLHGLSYGKAPGDTHHSAEMPAWGACDYDMCDGCKAKASRGVGDSIWGRRLLMAVFGCSEMILSQELGGGWILVLPRYINKDKSGNSKWLVKIDWLYPSLKPTAKAPENGWLESFPFLFGMAYFQLLLLLVSGAVNW